MDLNKIAFLVTFLCYLEFRPNSTQITEEMNRYDLTEDLAVDELVEIIQEDYAKRAYFLTGESIYG